MNKSTVLIMAFAACTMQAIEIKFINLSKSYIVQVHHGHSKKAVSLKPGDHTTMDADTFTITATTYPAPFKPIGDRFEVDHTYIKNLTHSHQIVLGVNVSSLLGMAQPTISIRQVNVQK